MLNNKEKDLCNYLKKMSDWVTAAELAVFCTCSTRTIRSRVAKLNQSHPSLILSSRLGYRFNENKQYQNNGEVDRESRIFLDLLKQPENGVDFFDLADSLFISESTLKQDIQRLKSNLVNDPIQIVFEGNYVKLTGTERAKRGYLISLLYDESDLQEKLKQSIQDMIGYLSLDKLNGLVQEVLSAHHMQLNQYVLDNISLHLAISMARIKQGHTLMSCPKHELLKRKSTFKIAEEIADKLAQEYDIQFSEIELAQLSLLFIGLQNDSQHHLQNDTLTCLIDKEIIQALETVLAEVERTYLVDLHDTAFFNQLAIHLQSLYHRSRYDTFTRNNSLMDLKSAYPLTYDLAVYIASLIQEQLSIKINDDEIAFIALHIGAYLENERYDKNRISLHLFVNDYHDIGKKMREKLMRYFGKRVTVDVIEKTDLAPLSSELLITTDQAIASTYEHAVKVQPFLRAKDLKKIAQAIDTLSMTREKRHICHLIDTLIPADLYFGQVASKDLTPVMIRKRLYQRMQQANYVDQTFLCEVEKREKMSPTSFPSGIAVPHAVARVAFKSGVSIMTLRHAIIWENYPVKLVACIAINQADARVFNRFFEQFIMLVSDDTNAKKLSSCSSHADFISTLKAMVMAGD